VVRRYALDASRAAGASRLDLAALNEEQRRAVTSDARRILILAGAGTGKTRTLTHRVAHLIDRGVAPERIVLVTFTNRAAREMIDRIELLLGPSSRRVRAGTFHALGYGALRRHGAAIGFDARPIVLAREDQIEVMASAIADTEVRETGRRFPSPEALIQLLSLAINTDRTLSATLASRPHLAPLEAEIEAALARYAEKKRAMAAVDFDDLLLLWKALLVEDTPARDVLRGEIDHVLVDEYQDTNRLQGEIAELLAARTGNLCVVGDDAQSIFSFRGARLENLLEFAGGARSEPVASSAGAETATFRLTESYRSTRQILAVAGDVIARNTNRLDKTLCSERSGLLPALIPTKDPLQQAAFVAQRVLELADEGVPLAEQAVLYRAHAHAVEIQLELTKRGVPYVVRSGPRFLEQAHVKDLVAFLRIIESPRDEPSTRRVLAILPGVGRRSTSRIWSAITPAVLAGRSTAEALRSADLGLTGRARRSLDALASLLEAVAPLASRPGDLVRALIDGNGDLSLADHVAAVHANAPHRVEELLQLATIAAQFRDLGELLAEIALVNDLSGEDLSRTAKEREHLTLSTVHQAKGLEWRSVFVVGLSDGAFPHQTSLEEPGGEEEERRLFYVAVTRAKDQLHLAHPASRLAGDRDRILTRPSRFLGEIAEGHVERWVIDEV
jgi:DNA helicase-2/ATP-dependent DNA helicase PcrA